MPEPGSPLQGIDNARAALDRAIQHGFDPRGRAARGYAERIVSLREDMGISFRNPQQRTAAVTREIQEAVARCTPMTTPTPEQARADEAAEALGGLARLAEGVTPNPAPPVVMPPDTMSHQATDPDAYRSLVNQRARLRDVLRHHAGDITNFAREIAYACARFYVHAFAPQSRTLADELLLAALDLPASVAIRVRAQVDAERPTLQGGASVTTTETQETPDMPRRTEPQQPAPEPPASGIGGATFDRTRTFGVELECYGVPRATLIAAMGAEGLTCREEGYNHDRRRHWKIVSDGSIHGEDAFELVSPVLSGDAGLEQIRKACRALNATNARVNRSCGFHVHHGAADLGSEHLRNLLTLWWKYEEVTNFFVPPSRRNNHFCAPVTPLGPRHPGGYPYRPPTDGTDEVEAFRRFVNSGRTKEDFAGRARDCGGPLQPTRYAAVNFNALSCHDTVEFRSHSGTTSADKIIAWVALTQWYVTLAKSGRACRIGPRMTGTWAKESRFYFRAIHWVNISDPVIQAAKDTLRARFLEFRRLADEETASNARQTALRSGVAAIERAVADTYRDAAGRVRMNPEAAQRPEIGE